RVEPIAPPSDEADAGSPTSIEAAAAAAAAAQETPPPPSAEEPPVAESSRPSEPPVVESSRPSEPPMRLSDPEIIVLEGGGAPGVALPPPLPRDAIPRGLGTRRSPNAQEIAVLIVDADEFVRRDLT